VPLPKNLVRRALVVGAILCGVAAVPALLVAGYVAYYTFVPRYMAVGEFEKYAFNLRLEFYRTSDEAADSGRYINLVTGTAVHRWELAGRDWPHYPRTGVYRVDDGRFAVLSPFGSDYLFTLKPFAREPVISARGDRWQYLGAFDFAFPRDGGPPRLQFFDQQLAECIPMGTTDPATWTDKPRAAMRHATCPSAELD